MHSFYQQNYTNTLRKLTSIRQQQGDVALIPQVGLGGRGQKLKTRHCQPPRRRRHKNKIKLNLQERRRKTDHIYRFIARFPCKYKQIIQSLALALLKITGRLRKNFKIAKQNRSRRKLIQMHYALRKSR